MRTSSTAMVGAAALPNPEGKRGYGSKVKHTHARASSSPALPVTRADGLYTWQAEALETWRNSHHCGVVEAVTGTGKTRIGIEAAAEAVRAGMPTVVMVPTADLLEQWQQKLQRALPGVRIGRFDGHRHDSFEEADILVGVVNSIARSYRDGFGVVSSNRRGLLVADECHHYAAGAFAQALSTGFRWRLGLTATYQRTDHLDETILDPYFGGIIFRLGYKRALSDRIISDFDIALVSVELDPMSRQKYEEQSRRILDLRRKLGGYFPSRRVPDDIEIFMRAVTKWAAVKPPTPRSTLANKYIIASSNRRGILADTPVKIAALDMLAPAVKAARGALVFTQKTQAAEAAVQRLGRSCRNVYALHSGQSNAERRANLEHLRRGEATALAAPRVLDEGIDVPDADLGIVLATHHNRRQMAQRLGRVIRRKNDGRIAKFVIVYAAHTVEDPTDSSDDFLIEILDNARHTIRVALEGHGPRLLAFLRNPPRDAPVFPRSQSQSVAVPSSTTNSEDRGYRGPKDTPVELLGNIRYSSDLVKLYLRQIGRRPLIKAEREVELARLIEAGEIAQKHLDDQDQIAQQHSRRLLRAVRTGTQARQQFVCANLRLVVGIAKHFPDEHEGGIELIDRIQFGNLGLLHAIQKFDYRKGFKFSTYATWWIRQSIDRGIADTARTIRVPVHMVEKMERLSKLRTEYMKDAGEPPSAPQATSSLKITDEDLQSIERVRRLIPISLDMPCLIQDEDCQRVASLAEAIPDDSQRPEWRTAIRLRHEALGRLMAHVLDHRSYLIIVARFGLDGTQPRTLDAIGEDFNISRERVRQLVKAALDAIREHADEFGPGTDLL